jgi:hypothetical protein
MSVSTDVTRGVLGVPGAPFALLLPRSTDFHLLYDALRFQYQDSLGASINWGYVINRDPCLAGMNLDGVLLLSIVQLLWDRLCPRFDATFSSRP